MTAQKTPTATVSATQRNALKLIPLGFGGSAQRIGISLIIKASHEEHLPILNPVEITSNILFVNLNTQVR